MKRMLQLSFFAVAIIFLIGSTRSVEAQYYGFSDNGLRYGNYDRPRYISNRRKAKRIKRRIRRNKSQIARRSARTERLNRKARKRKRSKRKVASLGRKTIRKKKKQSFAKRSKGPVQIVVSLPKQRVSIYEGGKVIASARVSTGRLGHRTPAGVFSIIQKHKDHFSNLYNSAPMPYMQRITWSGIALHAGNVSRPYASHGCIRLPYGFAKKLFRRTRMGAHVIVASSPSSPKSITHANLFQPIPKGGLLASNGIRTAAYTDISTAGDAGPAFGIGGLPDFVKPVIVAANRLVEKQKALEVAVAEDPAYQLTLAGAKKHLEERRISFKEAGKLAVVRNKSLRKPWAVVRKIKRLRVPKVRALNKAKGRAKWAWLIVEKRRDNPKFEGNWMKMALARAAKRDVIVAQAQLAVDELTQRLDVATTEYDAMGDAHRQSREMVSVRKKEVRTAVKLVKKAKSDLVTSKRAIKAAKKAVRLARAKVKSAQAREKMPLRILITSRRGLERTKDVQKMLAELGYEAGAADGVMGRMTRGAIKAFQLDRQETETGKISDKLLDDLYDRVGRTQKANAHMYVRQGFLDLFDIPVDMTDPAKPLGTHVYTAMHFEDGATSTEWTALTVRDAKGKIKRKRKGKKRRKTKRVQMVSITAQQALDRINIPSAVRRQVAMLLTPGSSMVISDKGMSHETGKGTDFVVLTK